MKRRIFAWALLIGFVLLLLNLIVFRIYWQLSMVIYLIIVFAFLLTNGKLVNTQGKDTENFPQGNDNEGDDSSELNNSSGPDDSSELSNSSKLDDSKDDKSK